MFILATSAPVHTTEAPAVEEAKVIDIGDTKEIEKYVSRYFSDIPIMVDIAWCESRFRHVGKTGSVIRGEINRSDLGVMQINEYYHGDAADTLGLDLLEFGDNMAYARYLFEKEGTTPWLSSSPCWGKENHIAKR